MAYSSCYNKQRLYLDEKKNVTTPFVQEWARMRQLVADRKVGDTVLLARFFKFYCGIIAEHSDLKLYCGKVVTLQRMCVFADSAALDICHKNGEPLPKVVDLNFFQDMVHHIFPPDFQISKEKMPTLVSPDCDDDDDESSLEPPTKRGDPLQPTRSTSTPITVVVTVTSPYDVNTTTLAFAHPVTGGCRTYTVPQTITMNVHPNALQAINPSLESVVQRGFFNITGVNISDLYGADGGSVTMTYSNVHVLDYMLIAYTGRGLISEHVSFSAIAAITTLSTAEGIHKTLMEDNDSIPPIQLDKCNTAAAVGSNWLDQRLIKFLLRTYNQKHNKDSN